jgi:hypothetical protein
VTAESLQLELKEWTGTPLVHFLACWRHVRLKSNWMYVHGFMYSFFLYIFTLHVSGAICTQPQKHKLPSTALGVCNDYGMLVHWSRYWLEHPHTFSTVPGHNPHTPTTQSLTWVAYQALTTSWGWQLCAETCRGRKFGKNPLLPWVFVDLIANGTLNVGV